MNHFLCQNVLTKVLSFTYQVISQLNLFIIYELPLQNIYFSKDEGAKISSKEESSESSDNETVDFLGLSTGQDEEACFYFFVVVKVQIEINSLKSNI